MAENYNAGKPNRVTPEQAAFLEDMYNKYSRALELYAYRFLNYDSRTIFLIPDAIQDVYLKAVKDVDKLMRHENVLGWLKKSCEYSLLSMLRKRRTSKEILSDSIEKIQLKSEEETLKSFTSWSQRITVNEVLEATCKILSPEDQQIFSDYFGENLTMQQTAEKNNMSTDKVRGKISRIRKRLKSYFITLSMVLLFIVFVYRM